MERKQTDKILQYDKEFHRHFYEMCDRNYWYTLLESLSPHFDRTTVLSFRCRPVNGIVSDHEELVDAIAARDRERAAELYEQAGEQQYKDARECAARLRRRRWHLGGGWGFKK